MFADVGGGCEGAVPARFPRHPPLLKLWNRPPSPASPQYTDQAGDWAACRMVPMHYDWTAIGQAATATQWLRTAPG